MKIRKRLFIILTVFGIALGSLLPAPALAGGPLAIKDSGRPFLWANGGRNIGFRTDLGGLGPMNNAEVVVQTVAAFNRWEAVSTSTVSFVNEGPLPVDVDETNFAQFEFGPRDTIHPIIYDEDGAIFDLIFGQGSGIAGFASVGLFFPTGEIVDGVIFLNGGAITPNQFGFLTANEFFPVQVHEIGHFIGLDHSVVNGEINTIGDATGPTPHDTFPQPASFVDNVEVMYPFTLPGLDLGNLHADDRGVISTLYPEPNFNANSGTITGRVLGLNGRTPLNGINVIARNLANPFGDAVSAISGNFATLSPSDPLTGVYRLTGLTPGAQYAVYVDEISFGGFSVEPRFSLPGPEEFYNGAAESNHPDTDHPNQFTPLTAVAGSPLSDLDVTFNRLLPGPLPIEAFINFERPRGWAELLLPFEFEIGGQKFETVFLNITHGVLTFGSPVSSHIFNDRPLRQHLLGTPRISGLMVTLEPYLFGLGVVSFEQTSNTFTVRYRDIPEFRNDFTPGGPNTFSMILHKARGRAGNLVTLDYGQTDARNAIVGYSCGSPITSGYEAESDLSNMAGHLIRGQGQSAIFEEFAGQSSDLDNRTLTFQMPEAFKDKFEPNNSRGRATRVNLPFNTADKFVDITRGDVDFYRFRAKAGEILVAETVTPGVSFFALDTLIGLFGPGGTLLAENDDILPFLPSSRLIFTVPVDGEYAVAVTTSGDVNFTGSASEPWRYNLTLNTYRGTILPLDGDDVTHELPLRFAFPFQGNDWRSVWVSSNGNLTFGAPEPVNTIEDLRLEGLLNGPPRIAPYFTDLDPSGTFNFGVKGFVVAEQDRHSLTVHWVSVPMIFDFDTNSFSVKLNSEGGIRMKWGAALGEDFDARGTIVGITQGGGLADPGPTDLSRLRNATVAGTTYEQFAAFQLRRGRRFTRASDIPSFDLSFDKLKFGNDDEDDGDDDDDRPETLRVPPGRTVESGRKNE